ncbi:MAG: serine/threonine-protein kinase [Myxococcota bacterium]
MLYDSDMAEDAPHVGTILAERYRISRLVEESTLGQRFVARDRETRKQVAVLMVPPHLMAAHGAHFVEVGEAARSVKGPGMVHVLATGLVDGHGFRVTDWERSMTLSEALEEATLLSSTVSWLADVARTLDEAHGLGLVHAGVSPHSIRVARRNEPPGLALLDDWGLMRLFEGTDPMSSTGLLYTDGAAWLAPEYLQGRPSDAKSDLYALGCVLFRCLTGHPPFTGPSMKVMAAHVGEPVPPPSHHVSGIPHWLDDITIALLAKDPADRPTAAEVAVRLGEGAALLVDGAAHPVRVTANAAPERLPNVEIRGARALKLPDVVDRPRRISAPPAGRLPPMWFFVALALIGIGSFALSFLLCLGR